MKTFKLRATNVSVILVIILESSVSDPDPFGSVSFWSAGSGSWQQKISQNHGQFPQKSTKIIRISYIFFKTIKLIFTDINIYPIKNKTDHISEKYIFYRKKVKQTLIFSRFQVGFGAGSVISRNGSEDPDPDTYQNETDPKHCLIERFSFIMIFLKQRPYGNLNFQKQDLFSKIQCVVM